MTSSPTPLAELNEALERLAGGADLLPSELPVLSDLDREQVRVLEASWPRIPDEVRVRLVTEAVRLSDETVDVEFSRFARVAVGDPLAEVRAAAVEALRESPHRATARALTAVVRDDDSEDVAAAAADILGEFVLRLELGRFAEREGEAVVDGLRAAVADPARAPAVRASALESLAPRSLEWIEGLMLEAYYGDDETVRLAAVRAMGLSAREEWLEYVMEQFDSGDPEFRREAAIAAGEIASEDAVARLADLFVDADEDVAKAAVEAVGEIGGEVAIEYLREFAEEAPEGWLDLVREALDAASGVRPDYEESTDEHPRRPPPARHRCRLRRRHRLATRPCRRDRGRHRLRGEGTALGPPQGHARPGGVDRGDGPARSRGGNRPRVALGEKVGVIDYWFSRDGRRYHKRVHHWLMTAQGGDFAGRDHEFDEVVWAPANEALAQITFETERAILEQALAVLEGDA